MAASISNIKLPIALFLLLISISLSCADEYSGLLSRLYKKASQNNRPLILVIENSKQGKVKDDFKVKSYQSSGENKDSVNPLTYLYQMAQSQKKTSEMKKPLKMKHTHVHEIKDLAMNLQSRDSRDRRQRLRSRDDQRDSQDRRDKKDRKDNKILNSPVMKSLLRMANGLRCAARDECEDKCDAKFNNGKQHEACEDKCEQKFDCDEEEEEKDPCNDTDDECGETTTDCNMSTKAERFYDVTPKCKRC